MGDGAVERNGALMPTFGMWVTEQRYWVQTQAPAGNWVDSMGTGKLEDAHSYADYERSHGNKARVVERQNREVGG